MIEEWEEENWDMHCQGCEFDDSCGDLPDEYATCRYSKRLEYEGG
jgi:hypothetical protein